MAKEYTDQIVFDAKVSERKILILPIESIKYTPYNPPSRTKEGAVLEKLIRAIKKHGLVYPILITEDRDVIDGNRRLAACRIAGKKEIDCIVSPLDKDEVFSTINTTSVNMGGKGWLVVARGGGSLPAKEEFAYKELFNLVGTYGIDLLIQKNIGLNILPLCKTVCSQGTSWRLEEVIMTTALKKLSNKLNAIIRSESTRADKVKAIDALLSE